MSYTHHDTGNCASRQVNLRHELENAGWRYTSQRAAVYECLCAGHNHPTAEEIYAVVRRELPKISLATVYKALEALVNCRLANKLTAADGPCRYDCRTEPHYHLHCLRTQRIEDLDTTFDPHLIEKLGPALTEALQQQGFHLTGYHLELLGYFGEQKTDSIAGAR
jgi:Fur family transcriptional regulator, peroxide stress response regulator